MSINPNDINIAQVGGGALVELSLESGGSFGLTTQIRSANTTATSVSCIVKRGSKSVTLSPIAASGQVSVAVSAANLTSLGAQRMDVLTAYWVIEITDGSDITTLRREQVLGVGDSQLAMPLDWADLTTIMPQLHGSCVVPEGQTSMFPQVSRGLAKLRADINTKQTGVKTYLMSNHEELRELAILYAANELLAAMITQTSGQGASWFHTYREELKGDRDKRWEALAITVKESAETFTNDTGGARTRKKVKPVNSFTGNASGVYGGPW